MAANSPEIVVPTERLRGMLGGRFSTPQPDTSTQLDRRVRAFPQAAEAPAWQDATPAETFAPEIGEQAPIDLGEVEQAPDPEQTAPHNPAREQEERIDERGTEMLTERTAAMPTAGAETLWTSRLSDAEKMRVLEGFHRWVLIKTGAPQADGDDAAALRQAMHEIVGAAGLVTALLGE